MFICVDCKKEMKCRKNGVNVRYGHGHTHAYAGDTYKCPECGRTIIHCNDKPCYSENIQPCDILMD